MSDIPLQVDLDTDEQIEISPNPSTKTPSVSPSNLLRLQSEMQQSLLEFLTEEREARRDLQSQIQLIYTLIPKPDLTTTDRRSGVSPADKPRLELESNDYLQQQILAQQSNPFSTSMGTINAPISTNIETNLSSPPLINSASSDAEFFTNLYIASNLLDTANITTKIKNENGNKNKRRLSTDTANPDYITNKQLVSTTQSIPVCTLSIDELTAPGVMAFQRLIEHWQQKHGTVLRIQNHITYRLEESVLAYYAPELNRAKWWSILMTNSKIIKLFQRMIMPRDRITFAKTPGSVRFPGNNDLRDLIKDFPDYLQSFLLFIKNFKEMHEFLAEDNSKDNISGQDGVGQGWSWAYQAGGEGSRGDSRGLASQEGQCSRACAYSGRRACRDRAGRRTRGRASGRCRWDTGLFIHACRCGAARVVYRWLRCSLSGRFLSDWQGCRGCRTRCR